jgi:hypothetical protein
MPSYMVTMQNIHMPWQDVDLMCWMYAIARTEGYLERDADMIVDSMVSVLYRPEKPISLLHAREIIVESAKGLGITLEPAVTAVKTIQAHFRGYQKRRSIVVKEKAIFATNSNLAVDPMNQLVEFMQLQHDDEMDAIVGPKPVDETASFTKSLSVVSSVESIEKHDDIPVEEQNPTILPASITSTVASGKEDLLGTCEDSDTDDEMIHMLIFVAVCAYLLAEVTHCTMRVRECVHSGACSLWAPLGAFLHFVYRLAYSCCACICTVAVWSLPLWVVYGYSVSYAMTTLELTAVLCTTLLVVLCFHGKVGETLTPLIVRVHRSVRNTATRRRDRSPLPYPTEFHDDDDCVGLTDGADWRSLVVRDGLIMARNEPCVACYSNVFDTRGDDWLALGDECSFTVHGLGDNIVSTRQASSTSSFSNKATLIDQRRCRNEASRSWGNVAKFVLVLACLLSWCAGYHVVRAASVEERVDGYGDASGALYQYEAPPTLCTAAIYAIEHGSGSFVNASVRERCGLLSVDVDRLRVEGLPRDSVHVHVGTPSGATQAAARVERDALGDATSLQPSDATNATRRALQT